MIPAAPTDFPEETRMSPIRALLLATALATTTPALAAPVPYTIDSNHTQVIFSYSHFGLSTITGRFANITGTFAFDAADPTNSTIAVTIPIDSVSMGVPRLDEHLKSADFFDATVFPTATFASTKVTAGAPGHLSVAGNLTVHGVSKPVVLDVVINKIGVHPMTDAPAAGFDATTTLKRSDFGVGAYAPNVGDEVTLRITMESHLAEPAAPAK